MICPWLQSFEDLVEWPGQGVVIGGLCRLSILIKSTFAEVACLTEIIYERGAHVLKLSRDRCAPRVSNILR